MHWLHLILFSVALPRGCGAGVRLTESERVEEPKHPEDPGVDDEEPKLRLLFKVVLDLKGKDVSELSDLDEILMLLCCWFPSFSRAR